MFVSTEKILFYFYIHFIIVIIIGIIIIITIIIIVLRKYCIIFSRVSVADIYCRYW